MAREVMGRKHLTRCGKCCYYCRQVTTFLFSHIGLCTVLIGYALMGAFTFQVLEAENERTQRKEMLDVRQRLVIDLWNITQSSVVLRQNEWSRNAEQKLVAFEQVLLKAVLRKGYDGSDDIIKPSKQWSFSGSLLYSIIVITTIGYGNVAPRTDWGKLVTIFYAIIGIPLMLFCLSSIGHAMAHSFKFIYWKCCCYLCVTPKRHRRSARRRRQVRRKKATVVEQIELQPITSATTTQPQLYSYNSATNWLPSKYSDKIESTPIICNKYALNDEIIDSHSSGFPGPPPTPSANPPSFQSLHLYPPPKPMNHFRFGNETLLQNRLEPLTQMQQTLTRVKETEEEEDTDETDDESEREDNNIPITVCLTLVVGYICGGAWFFAKSEGWSFLNASYFCFITLSTIGFGDLVPGNLDDLSKSETDQMTLAICALYLLFGMALLAMSLNLVKEKVTEAVRAIGQRIGILVKDDDDF